MPKMTVPKAHLKIEINISQSGDFYSIYIDGEHRYQEKIYTAIPYNELLREAVQTVYKICTAQNILNKIDHTFIHLKDNPVTGIDSYISTNPNEDKQ